MYIPAQFRIEHLPQIHAAMRATRLASLVTIGPEGLMATPLPMMLDPAEGKFGTLYAHVARANPQWRTASAGEGLAIFPGPDAYVSPSLYPSKQRDGRVVPTWNYVAVHAYGVPEFFEDAAPLLDVVRRLTELHEGARAQPWAVSDAPATFIQSELKGIVGVRMGITRLEGKRKASQNRQPEDRAGVKAALAASARPDDRAIAGMIPGDGDAEGGGIEP
jgi:transcriptional regulator